MTIWGSCKPPADSQAEAAAAKRASLSLKQVRRDVEAKRLLAEDHQEPDWRKRRSNSDGKKEKTDWSRAFSSTGLNMCGYKMPDKSDVCVRACEQPFYPRVCVCVWACVRTRRAANNGTGS